jgi:hypothetical protein
MLPWSQGTERRICRYHLQIGYLHQAPWPFSCFLLDFRLGRDAFPVFFAVLGGMPDKA